MIQKRRQERLDEMLQFLKENEKVTRQQLLDRFQINKSDLSGDLKLLKAQHPNVDTSERGKVYLREDSVNDQKAYESMDQYTIRRWFILNDILTSYSFLRDNSDGFRFQDIRELSRPGALSESTLWRDLEWLIKRNYISKKECEDRCIRYQPTGKLIAFSPDDALLEQLSGVNGISFSQHVDNGLLKKLSFLTPSAYAENIQSIHGRDNQVSEHTIDLIQSLMTIRKTTPNKSLKLTLLNKNGTEKTVNNYSLAMCLYSPERNQFYLWGTAKKHPNLIKLDDSLIRIESADKDSVPLDLSEYETRFAQMYSITGDEEKRAVHYKLRFLSDDWPIVSQKVDALQRLRAGSKLYKDSTGDRIYEDDIIGQSAFRPVIRRFGKSVIVEEPESEFKQLYHAAERLVRAYEEVLKNE